MLNADVQPQSAERRTRREVRLGPLNPAQFKALLPAAGRQQQFTTYDGDNNIRFKIHVTDQKGAERPTKILATLAKGASFDRQDGVVKLTRSAFHTPTIREIGSDEDICQLDNDQSSDKMKMSKNVHDLWNEALVKNSEHYNSYADNSKKNVRPRAPATRQTQPSHGKEEAPATRQTQPSHGKEEVKQQWVPRKSQNRHEIQKRRRSPDNKISSPEESSSTSDQPSEDSLTQSNETGSNIYTIRAHGRDARDREGYQQGASILKTPTSNAVARSSLNDIPFYPQEDARFARLQPPFEYLPSARHTVQPCVTCQYAPCSACRTPICVVCMAAPCASCRAPLCSACSIESYSANNETLCMSCTLAHCSPYRGALQYNRSASTGGESPMYRSGQNVATSVAHLSAEPSVRNQPYRGPRDNMLSRGASSNNLQTYEPPGDIQTYVASRSVPTYEESRGRTTTRVPRNFPPLPPGYPNSLSPCSPYIDWAARRNLPPLIPNYVCEPLACNPDDGVPDNMSCHSASILPRKNKFLELISKNSPGPAPGCAAAPSPCCCCCQQENIGDRPLVYPANFYQCGVRRNPCDEMCSYPEDESCFETLLNILWIMLPILGGYVMGYFGTVRLMGLNKFSRLAAVMANTTLMYIESLEPDDLIMYTTDKPTITHRPCVVDPIPCHTMSRSAPCPEPLHRNPCHAAPPAQASC